MQSIENSQSFKSAPRGAHFCKTGGGIIPPPPFSALTFIKIDIGLYIGSQDCICQVLKHLTNAAVSSLSLNYETAEFLLEIKERLSLKPCALLREVVGSFVMQEKAYPQPLQKRHEGR